MAPISNVPVPLGQISAALGTPCESVTAQVGVRVSCEKREPFSQKDVKTGTWTILPDPEIRQDGLDTFAFKMPFVGASFAPQRSWPPDPMRRR